MYNNCKIRNAFDYCVPVKVVPGKFPGAPLKPTDAPDNIQGNIGMLLSTFASNVGLLWSNIIP